MQGTILAHTRGGVPNLVLEVPAINEEEYGYMVYFFMLACGVSGYLLGVDVYKRQGLEQWRLLYGNSIWRGLFPPTKWTAWPPRWRRLFVSCGSTPARAVRCV